MTKKIEQIVLTKQDGEQLLEAINNLPKPNANLKALFSSEKDNWETPDDFFAAMEQLFGKFDFDAAADNGNYKCETYLSPDLNHDGLEINWSTQITSKPRGKQLLAWLNPPYGRGITGKWVEKAYKESQKGVQTVLLLPARTDTKWYKLCHEKAAEIYFITGRLKFKGAKHSAPFPSMVVVFRKDNMETRRIGLMNNKGEVVKV